MADLIDRAELIKALEKRCGMPFRYIKMLLPSTELIEKAQEFKLKRQEGKWIYGERPAFEDFPFIKDGFWVCSCCHEEYEEISNFNFCPHCGAKMEVSKE